MMPSTTSILSAALTGAMVLGTTQAQLFTVNCATLTIQRGDPIVAPGGLSPHVHVVTGGTAFQFTETNAQARNAKATTCDKLLDKSNYWQPQLYHQRTDGRFELVTMQGNVSIPALLHPTLPAFRTKLFYLAWALDSLSYMTYIYHFGGWNIANHYECYRPHITLLVRVTMFQADRTVTVLRFLLHPLKVFAWLSATHSAGMYTPSLLYTMP